MYLTKQQIHWISTLTDNSQLLAKYFQLNAKQISQKHRSNSSRRHVYITTQYFKCLATRRLIIKYNRLRFRGGTGKYRKRQKRERIWKYYDSVFILRGSKKGRRSHGKRKAADSNAQNEKKDDVSTSNTVAGKSSESVIKKNGKNDDMDFVYYQSSEDEDECANGIIKSSAIVTSKDDSTATTERRVSDANEDEAIESDVPSPASVTSENQSSIDGVELSPTRSVEQNDEAMDHDDGDDGIAMSELSRSTRYSNDSTAEANDIGERLRQQLEILKKGEKKINLLSTKPSERLSFISRRSSSNLSMASRSNSNGDLRRSENSSASNTPRKKSQDEVVQQKVATTSSVSKIGFIDTLISKIKSTTPVTRAHQTRNVYTAAQPNARKSISSPHKSKSNPVTTAKIGSNDKELSESCTSPEFFGFDSASYKSSDLSALLPTPRVRNSVDKQSVFVSEDLDTFMKENALDNVAKVSIPTAKQVRDEAMLTEDAEPPSMKVPQRPNTMERPRTLAEKRLMLEKRKDFRFLMIENESSIYHELRKRRKENRSINTNILNGFLNGNIPTTRDCWRATCWLNTNQNNFFFQTIETDDRPVKVFGGQGNNRSKILCKVSQDVKNGNERARRLKGIKCGRICAPIDKSKINNFDEYYRELTGEKEPHTIASQEETRKIGWKYDDASYMKPGPLCSKVAQKRTSVDAEYGPFQTFRLPTVQLEVWPKLEKPLPEQIKPYMKYLIPHAEITDEWAKFAVSAVKAPAPRRRNSRKYKKYDDDMNSFVFDIPYVNDQKRILVRKRRMHDHWDMRPMLDNYVYKFADGIDRSDEVAVECADILSQMITSVDITSHENSMIKRDPDIDYVGKWVPIHPPAVSNDSAAQKAANKHKSSPSTEGLKTTKSKIM